MSASDEVPRREVAYRLFAAEFDDSTIEISAGESDRSPNYLITPTGARVNRVFVVGVVTEIEWVNDDVLRARVADPTGAFVLYAGQYQPDALSFLERLEPPAFVAVTGKANTFQPDGSDRIFTSVRPETITEVDATTRDHWTVETAEHSLERVDQFAAALGLSGQIDQNRLVEAGFPEPVAQGIAVAKAEYDTSAAYLAAVREMAIDAIRLVAEETDSVRTPPIDPDDPGDGPALAELRLPSERRFEPVSVDPSTTDDPVQTAEVDAGEAESTTGGGPPTTAEGETADGIDDDSIPAIDEEGMYELDEEEREAVEDEYGTEFTTGAAVESPASEELAATGSAAGRPVEVEDEPSADERGEDDAGSTADERGEDGRADASDIDPVDIVMETLRDLADGEPVERSALESALQSDDAIGGDEIEDAIKDALMSGRCYEPEDGLLRPI